MRGAQADGGVRAARADGGVRAARADGGRGGSCGRGGRVKKEKLCQSFGTLTKFIIF